MYGLSDDEITAIVAGDFASFSAPEIALLRMADGMADTPSNLSDEFYAELRRHFSEEQLIELAATAAWRTIAPVTTACLTWGVTTLPQRAAF